MHSGVHVAGVHHVLQSTGTGLSRTILRASRTVREVEEIGTTGQRTVHACREPSRVGHSAFELLKKPLEPTDTWTNLKLIQLKVFYSSYNLCLHEAISALLVPSRSFNVADKRIRH